MKLFLKIGFFIITTILLSGCAEVNINEQEAYIIKYGSECGWCAGQEYIVINNSKILYTKNIPCGDEKGKITKSRKVSSGEWDEIISLFDYSFFLKLDYNECNVCVDGCDEILQIAKDDSSHELRYSYSDNVEGMENLRLKLAEIMIEMQEMD